MKAANEDGYITVEQLEHLLKRYPITKNNPDLIQLYLRVSIFVFISSMPRRPNIL